MMEKVYKVQFMQYTNCFMDTVSDGNEDIGKRKYLQVGNDPVIIKESDLSKYMKFGNGFRSVEFIGNLI